MDNDLITKRRKEYHTPSFRDNMITELGCVCVNCGRDNSQIAVEYHHIVPLVLGGTNNLGNIVPLCNDCHKLAHGARTIRKISHAHGNVGGRPRFKPVDNYKEILDRFIRGEIGKTECQKLVGMKAGKLNDMDFYHDYLEEKNIIHMRNLVDFHKSKCADTDIVSYIVCNDGTRIDYTESGKEIKSTDMPTVIKYQNKKRKTRRRVRTIAE